MAAREGGKQVQRAKWKAYGGGMRMARRLGAIGGAAAASAVWVPSSFNNDWEFTINDGNTSVVTSGDPTSYWKYNVAKSINQHTVNIEYGIDYRTGTGLSWINWSTIEIYNNTSGSLSDDFDGAGYLWLYMSYDGSVNSYLMEQSSQAAGVWTASQWQFPYTPPLNTQQQLLYDGLAYFAAAEAGNDVTLDLICCP